MLNDQPNRVEYNIERCKHGKVEFCDGSEMGAE